MKTTQATARDYLQGSIGKQFCVAIAKEISNPDYIKSIRLIGLNDTTELIGLYQLKRVFLFELLQLVRKEIAILTELMLLVRLKTPFLSELIILVRLKRPILTELLLLVQLKRVFLSDIIGFFRFNCFNASLCNKTLISDKTIYKMNNRIVKLYS